MAAKVYQIQRTKKVNGKRVPLFDAAGKPVMLPKWRVRITLASGKKKKYTLSAPTEAGARKQAAVLEAQEWDVRSGLRPAPSPHDLNAHLHFTKVTGKYLAWGEMQGGRDGRPWARSHYRNVRTYLEWLGVTLRFVTIGDAEGCLARIEDALREVARTGRRRGKRGGGAMPGGLSGKSLQNMAAAFRAFFAWCATPGRDYLRSNPLAGLRKFNTDPRQVRRDLDEDEVQRLLAAATPAIRLLLETAICSGLRWGELRALTVHHLELDRLSLRVDASRDKARKERHQPIPERLAHALAAFAASGEAKRLYRWRYARRDRTAADIPAEPLLFVPSHASRMLDDLAKKAGVPKVTPEGKLDFHALRVKYINLVVDTGADPKTVQTLARHATLHMTMNVYARAKRNRLSETAELVGARLFAPAPAAGEST